MISTFWKPRLIHLTHLWPRGRGAEAGHWGMESPRQGGQHREGPRPRAHSTARWTLGLQDSGRVCWWGAVVGQAL